MPEFKYTITIDCETADQAATVVTERLNHDEDFGFDYAIGFTSKPPVVQVLHSRDPDSECAVDVYINDVRVQADVEDIDPGRGWERADWNDRMKDWEDSDSAFGKAVYEVLASASGSEHIYGEDDRDEDDDHPDHAGYVMDEFKQWQQGDCDTYAVALLRRFPHLRLGVAGLTENGDGDASGGWSVKHFFAHDDEYAYDSLGRHSLPYLGVKPGQMDYAELDGLPEWWDPPNEDLIPAALAHIERHGIGPHDPTMERN